MELGDYGMDFGWPVIDWEWAIRAWLSHFGLGFWAVVCLYSLTLIIFRFFGVTRKDELRIRRYLLLLYLSLGVVAHVLEDYLLDWF